MSDVITKLFPDRGINCNTTIASALNTGRYSVYNRKNKHHCLGPSGFFNTMDNRLDNYLYYAASNSGDSGDGLGSDGEVVDVGGDGQSNNGSSFLTFNKPSSAREGDFAIVLMQAPAITPTGISYPTGWDLNHLDIDVLFPNAKQYVFTKRLGPSEPSTYTFNVGATDMLFGRLQVLRNVVENVEPVHSFGYYRTGLNEASSRAVVTNTTIDKCQLVHCLSLISQNANGSDLSTLDVAASGYTKMGHSVTTSGTYTGSLVMFRKEVPKGTNNGVNFNLGSGTKTHSISTLAIIPKKYYTTANQYTNDLETALSGLTLGIYWTRASGLTSTANNLSKYSLRCGYDSPGPTQGDVSIPVSIGPLGGTLTINEFGDYQYGTRTLLRNTTQLDNTTYQMNYSSKQLWVKRSYPIPSGNGNVIVRFTGDAENASNMTYRIDDIKITGTGNPI